jgi:hypothetical protein
MDYEALLGYGYILSEEDVNRLEELASDEELDDFFTYIDDNWCGPETIGFFGLQLAVTETNKRIPLDLGELVNEAKWQKCFRTYCRVFPDKEDYVPKFYLIHRTW